MADQIRISLKNNSIKGKIAVKGSKSISNRILIMAALAGKNVAFKNISNSDDTTRLQRSLKMIESCGNSRIPLIIDAGNAGTVMRFLAAFLSQNEGKWLLTGSDRMKKRPIGELVNALKKLGAKIEFPAKSGYPPLLITGTKIKTKQLTVDVSQSSQFVSALMMIAPYLGNGLTLTFPTPPVSFSYIEMTASLMENFDVNVELTKDSVKVLKGNYQLRSLTVEPDWSSASYWYELVALAPDADVFLSGYQKVSCQGDSVLPEIYKQLGVKTNFEEDGVRLTKTNISSKELKADCSSCPDLVPAILTSCAAIGVKARLKGVGHLKFKESDRVEVFKTELAKIGAKITVKKDEVYLLPATEFPDKEIEFNTYKDHRVAMSLAPLAFKLKSVVINDPAVVEKSYPSFWNDLKQLKTFAVDKI